MGTLKFARSNMIAAQSGMLSHLQLWNPPTPPGGQRRVARICKIKVSRSTGYFFGKHGLPVGPLDINPFSPYPNYGVAIIDDMPTFNPPLDQQTWWQSVVQVWAGNYPSIKEIGQYEYNDGYGMSYEIDTPVEFGPGSGLIVRNINPNQGLNFSAVWEEEIF